MRSGKRMLLTRRGQSSDHIVKSSCEDTFFGRSNVLAFWRSMEYPMVSYDSYTTLQSCSSSSFPILGL